MVCELDHSYKQKFQSQINGISYLNAHNDKHRPLRKSAIGTDLLQLFYMRLTNSSQNERIGNEIVQ